MNSTQLADYLLEAEEAWRPEGYRLLASTVAGEYELMLWECERHVEGISRKIAELSLNRKGLNFDPGSQTRKFPGSTMALGRRKDLLSTVAAWVKEAGTLYVGSHNPQKLSLYHRLLKHYLTPFAVSDPYPAFDESEGVADYFTVTAQNAGVVEALIEAGGHNLPDEQHAYDLAAAQYAALVEDGTIGPDNFSEWIESICVSVVDNLSGTSTQLDSDEAAGLVHRLILRLHQYATDRQHRAG